MAEEHGWGLRAPVQEAEKTRKWLKDASLLDPSYKTAREADDILFPVIPGTPGAEPWLFETRPERKALPRHELVGGIALLYEDDPSAAELLLRQRPSLHTVLFPESEVTGPLRVRRFRVLAGEETTATTVTEHHHRFRVDLARAYFSARLATERQRLLDCISPGEEVLDMFAGVGPFAITLSSRAGRVVAADINPDALCLLLQNLKLNRVKNVLPVLADAEHLGALFPRSFDRVIMNLPLDSRRFLPLAFSLCRPGGTVSWYVLQSREAEWALALSSLPVSSWKERFVRSYSPGKFHAVYEIRVAGPDPGEGPVPRLPEKDPGEG